MKTILVKTGKKLTYPTIVKIGDDHYAVSKQFNPEKGSPEKYIAIDLNNGEWFDWENKGVDMIGSVETFEEGTEFLIKI